jgi:hypothetical protein
MRDKHQQCNFVMENPVEACLGAVYTMDHEVVPHKRPVLRDFAWDDFHGPSY